MIGMALRALIAVGGLLIAIAGLFLGMNEVTALNHVGAQVSCGTAFSPRDLQALETSEISGDLQSAMQGDAVTSDDQAHSSAACAEALSNRKTWSLGLLIVGGLAAVGAGLTAAAARGPRSETERAKSA